MKYLSIILAALLLLSGCSGPAASALPSETALPSAAVASPAPTATRELSRTSAFAETAVSVGEYGLYGVLTLPADVEKPPVALLIHGSGPSDCDESILEQKPFRDIAHGLAERGIATLRYDKRTYAFPEKTEPTIQAETLDDAAAAIALLKADKRFSGVYLIGHSLGGMLAPRIAAENEGLAGIIALAGTPRGLEDVVYDQNMAAIDADESLTDVQKELQRAFVKTQIERIKAITEANKDETYLGGIPGGYWLSLNAVDTAEVVKTLTLPMLFLQGDADFQVSVQNDFEAWKTAAKGMKNANFQLYKGLNHLFMQTNGFSTTEDYETPAHVDTRVIEDIASWIKAN